MKLFVLNQFDLHKEGWTKRVGGKLIQQIEIYAKDGDEAIANADEMYNYNYTHELVK